MPTSNSWIVCEHSGRWAAALRIAVARQSTERPTPSWAPRIHEVRSLGELDSAIRESVHSLGLIEVRSDILAAVLELMAKSWRRNVRFVALLASERDRPPKIAASQFPLRRLAAEALSEAGALAVIDSPRHTSTVLNLAQRHFTSRSRIAAPSGEPESIADRAWAALPWQDA